MNTLSPFPSLQTPGLRDPLKCIFSFIGKCRLLAKKRADHGAVLEQNVLERFAVRERELREAGATSARLIADMIGALQEDYREALADGKLSAAEDKRIRQKLDELFGQLIVLQEGLAVPVAG